MSYTGLIFYRWTRVWRKHIAEIYIIYKTQLKERLSAKEQVRNKERWVKYGLEAPQIACTNQESIAYLLDLSCTYAETTVALSQQMWSH
jgi:hypothetical protein